jgi:hypothetical protein
LDGLQALASAAECGRIRRAPAGIAAMPPTRRPGSRRRIVACKGAAAAESGFFRDNGAGLLIVPALFFIQRRNGEVAEWSKALPC